MASEVPLLTGTKTPLKKALCCEICSQGWLLLAMVFTATIGGFLFGFDTGVISGAMLQIRAARDPFGGIEEDGLSNFQQEMVVSGAVAGAIMGASLSSWAADHLGRRGTLLYASAAFIMGALVMALAPGFTVLVFGRVVVGLSVGASSMVVPIYIAEAAPPSIRGQLVMLQIVMTVFGQVSASLVDCALADVLGGWRWMLGLGGVPALLMVGGLCVLPESPRWLVQQGHRERALAVLRAIRGADAPTSQSEACSVQAELESIEEQVQHTQGDALTQRHLLRQILSDVRIRSALALGCVLQLTQQTTGINTLMYYSATILQVSDKSADTENPFNEVAVRSVCLSAGTATAQLIGTLVGLCFVERLGRRVLTLGSLAAVCASLGVLGLAFHPGSESTRLAFGAMVVYLLTFGVGLAPMPWVVNSEIYPMQARSLCCAITAGVNWASNLIVLLTFLDLADSLSTDPTDVKHHPDGVFWLYAVIGATCGLWLYCKMPETKGLSLEQTVALFDVSSDPAPGKATSAPPT